MSLTKILIGDDQFGANSHLGQQMRSNFELDYREQFKDLAELTYTADPEEFIQLANTKQYSILLIDLNWEPEDSQREYKTGYRVLDAVKDCAKRRILWTSESKEAREKGFSHGATHCIPKGPIPEEMSKVLYRKAF